MFIEQYEVSEDLNSCGVIGIRQLSNPHYLVAAHRRGTGRDIFYWTASMLQDQLVLTSTLHFNFWSMLDLAMRFEDTDVIDYLFRSCPCNITKDWVTHTVGYRLMLKMRESDQTHLLCCMISHGMDLHSIFVLSPSFTDEFQKSTITILALRSSAAFFNLKTALKNLDINIPQFVCDEMQQGPAIAAGWTTQSLLAILDLDYVPNESLTYFLCPHKCSRGRCDYGRELSWEILLGKVKTGSDFSSGVEDMMHELEEDVIKLQSSSRRICSCCGKVGRSYATHDELVIEKQRINWDESCAGEDEMEEDSMFLLSI